MPNELQAEPATPLTGVLPADVLQVELWVVGHVLLDPGPAVHLLIRRGDDEEAVDTQAER